MSIKRYLDKDVQNLLIGHFLRFYSPNFGLMGWVPTREPWCRIERL